MSVDTSSEAVERLARDVGRVRRLSYSDAMEACDTAAATLRALAQERDALMVERDAERTRVALMEVRASKAEAERDAARAEVERLREAVRAFLACRRLNDKGLPAGWTIVATDGTPCLLDAESIARAALAAKENEQ